MTKYLWPRQVATNLIVTVGLRAMHCNSRNLTVVTLAVDWEADRGGWGRWMRAGKKGGNGCQAQRKGSPGEPCMDPHGPHCHQGHVKTEHDRCFIGPSGISAQNMGGARWRLLLCRTLYLQTALSARAVSFPGRS